MATWLLIISRDTELVRALNRLLIRSGSRGQLRAVDGVDQARRDLGCPDNLPSAILIDELFLRGELLMNVAEEFSWYAPLILVGWRERQAQVASLVAEGKADFVPRSDYFIPLAAALVERTLRWERELEEAIRFPEHSASGREGGEERVSDDEGFPAETLRMIGAILDNLEVVLGERSSLPLGIARRLGRVADLAFDLKQGLSLLAGRPGREDAEAIEKADRP